MIGQNVQPWYKLKLALLHQTLLNTQSKTVNWTIELSAASRHHCMFGLNATLLHECSIKIK